jgi:hypothetical protein
MSNTTREDANRSGESLCWVKLTPTDQGKLLEFARPLTDGV